MSIIKKPQTVASFLWISSIQYFVMQLIVGLQYSGYSLRYNTISDLGNSSPLTQSPAHILMNLSFVILGLAMSTGALLMIRTVRERVQQIGFICLVFAGFGTVLVGLFPENTVASLHILGAGLPFVLGNIGMIILGYRLTSLPKGLRIYSVLSGETGLLALGLFLGHIYLTIGIGGMERIVAYPQTLWLIVIGLYLLIRSSKVKNK